jgi:peptidoglycan/xylan/chitin deacetylase (PgdA/CDA1 family)
LDSLISSDNLAEIDAKVNSAIDSLNNSVDIFVIDAISHEPYGKDPIWEVPLSQWGRQDDTLCSQQRMLLQVKSFLQHQARKLQAQGNASLSPFSIVFLGRRSSFNALDQVIHKLQRDVMWLHPEASVNFLDVESPSGDASEQSIAGTIGILGSVKASGRIVSINNISDLRESKDHDMALSGRNTGQADSGNGQIYRSPSRKKPKVKVALSFDFDALSGYLGTGDHPDNNMSDYSAGIFAGRIGARRLLRMLQKYQLVDKVTWFIPGHTMETFEPTVKEIVQSGAEIGLHGYAHEGAYQMTPAQERDVLVKCMEVAQRLTGKRVQGYRAPLYQLRETTVELLKEFGFLYDSSLSHHDSQPYFTPSDPPIQRIDFSQPASSWMHPTPLAPANTPVGHPLVEIPTGWQNEDMMALQYFPHLHNSQGHVDARVIEQKWKDMFLWLWENSDLDQEDGSFVFPLLMHPDTSGMAHAIAMADRVVGWLRSWGDSVQFQTYAGIAQDWLNEQGK